MSGRFRILGCGSSGGVPRIGGNWGDCDPSNPKNRRLRSSAMVERWGDDGEAPNATRILIDTSPDIRQQLLGADVGKLDAVFFTHDHADHTHGIDDLRVACYNAKSRIDTYASAQTFNMLLSRFGYCFQSPEGSNYPPILDAHQIRPGKTIAIDGPGGAISALPYEQDHGAIRSLGFRFGSLAYSTDVSALEDEAKAELKGLDVWIVDALRYTTHPSHFSVDQALEMIDELKPKRAVLTHLHVDLDYDELNAYLPDHVEPAYDGMAIDFDL